MSISSSLNNALSGLTVASRSAQLVSANVANAATEGYGRRVLSVTGSAVTGAGRGARVLGVERLVNQSAIGDRRLSESGVGYSETMSRFFANLEAAIGTPDQASSLSARVADLEASLISAAAAPQSVPKLDQVAFAAGELSAKFNNTSDQIKNLRQQADTDIAIAVTQLNTGLRNLEAINEQVMRARATGADVSALLDERQVEIDQLAKLLPIREVQQPYDQISIVTANGTTLLGPNAAQIAFAPTAVIEPHMSLANNQLSGLSINGAASQAGNASAALAGGRIEALFRLRDQSTVEMQADLDAVARNLIERFSDPSVDPSVVPGQPALFTDRGAAFDPLFEVGLAGRISLNVAADLNQGGRSTALRDGLYAASGPAGDPALLNSMLEALLAVRTPTSGSFVGANSVSTLSTSLLTHASQALQQQEARLSFSQGNLSAFEEIIAQDSVNTDQELQSLLLVEQLYAANAKVISTVDEMLQQILGL